MKRIIKSCWLAFAVFLLTMQNVQANCWDLMDAECLAPLVLGDDYSKDKNNPKHVKEWSPVQGMVTTIGYSLFFQFKFDNEAIRIIRSNPLFSFEAEVVVEGSDRHKIKVTGFGASANLHSANIGLDTEASDSSSKRTIGLHFLDPQNLEAGVDYEFIIQTNKELANLNISIRPQTQILLDVSSYASLMNVFGIESWSNRIWDFYDQVGQYNYFALETDGFVKFNPYENGRDRKAVIWNDHKNSFVISVGEEMYGPWLFIGPSYTPPSANYTNNGTGAVEHSQPGESDHAGYKHNVSMDDTELARAGTDDYNRKWTFYHGEVPTVNVRVRLKNKGDEIINYFESFLYRSNDLGFNPNTAYSYGREEEVIW